MSIFYRRLLMSEIDRAMSAQLFSLVNLSLKGIIALKEELDFEDWATIGLAALVITLPAKSNFPYRKDLFALLPPEVKCLRV